MDFDNIKQEQQQKQLEQMRYYVLNTYFTTKAKQRLTNIKLVNKEKYNKIIDMVIAMVQNNDINSAITEKELIQFLKQTSNKKEFNIRRK